jgi:membrane associated rhomboid family serine protease
VYRCVAVLEIHRVNVTTPATLAILLVTVIISLIGLKAQPRLIEWCVFRPYRLVRQHQYHTLITSGLVHGSVMHLLFNMLTFYFFGPSLELTIGSSHFLTLYVVALILSEARTFLLQRNNPQYASLGASGAVSAVLFASIIYFPDQSIFILPIPIPIPAPLFAVCYLIYSWYLSRQGADRINHNAHIDGAITGLLFVAVTDSQTYSRLMSSVGV